MAQTDSSKQSSKTTKKTPVKKTTAKKVVRKATAPKKVTPKKTSAKKGSKKVPTTGKVLVCANSNECFWTNDGAILKDLAELRDALTAMSDAVYAYHVTKKKNDFAEWVEQVLRDKACAADLRKSKKPSSARTVIVRHLRSYTF